MSWVKNYFSNPLGNLFENPRRTVEYFFRVYVPQPNAAKIRQVDRIVGKKHGAASSYWNSDERELVYYFRTREAAGKAHDRISGRRIQGSRRDTQSRVIVAGRVQSTGSWE